LAVVDEIAAQPGLHAEARALVPALEAYVAPAGPDGVRTVLSALFVIYPQPKRDAAEWAVWWMTYMEDLEGFPMFALTQAVRDYRRDPASEWFPKPGALVALCNRHTLPAVKALGRARMAAKQPVKRVFAPRQPVIPTVKGMG
jgi:hypothetical protein